MTRIMRQTIRVIRAIRGYDHALHVLPASAILNLRTSAEIPAMQQPSRNTQGATLNGIQIVAEHDDWIVVSKPPFIEAHPSKPNGRRTLWHELRDLLAFELVNGGQVSIINRLDRETSGL